ncbi:MAG: gliding motility-associated C-terminal domain-containing protein [Cyclobacteriaceae bacterium]
MDAKCFNQAVGQATVTVNSGGASPYYYSLDAGTTWVSFTSPFTITNLMPAAAPYSILVGDDPSDPCPAQVMVTINNAVTDIQIASTTTDASCANNDGKIDVTSVSGGTGPYTYKLDGNGTSNLSFTGLGGGNHIFTVIDANSCSKDFPITVNFPGFVNFTTQAVSPDCSGTGSNGSILVTIIPSGSFLVGATNDSTNLNPPSQAVTSTGNTNVSIGGLTQGKYWIVAKPNGAFCTTLSKAVNISGGPVAVDFNFTSNNYVCSESNGTIKLYHFTGSGLVDYSYEVLNLGNTVQSGTITQNQALDTVALLNLPKGSYQIRLFQDQSAASGCASPISSAFKNFFINGPAASLDTLYVTGTGNTPQERIAHMTSLSNRPTGEIEISVKPSGSPPYQIEMGLVNPKVATQSFTLDWTTVPAKVSGIDSVYSLTVSNLYAGVYKINIRDAVGCVKSYYRFNSSDDEDPTNFLLIKISTDIFIPNIFTPNNDQLNDAFEIINLPDNPHIVITNRWGKEVFSSSSFQKKPGDDRTTIIWNGGSESDGIYYYTLNAGGRTYTGWVELLHPTN